MKILRLILLMITAMNFSFSHATDSAEWLAVTNAYSTTKATDSSDKLDEAYDLATKYAEQHPTDGRAMTYRGSLATMKAKDSLLPWKKLSSLNKGVDWMDEGVSIVTNDKALAGSRVEIEVRMVRGITSARIPALFGRGSVARADLMAVTATPIFKDITPANKATAFAWLAVLLRRQNDSAAGDWLKQARAADEQVASSIWVQFK